MRVKFREDTRYVENGFDVRKGKKGETRDIGDSQACALIRAGKAELLAESMLGKADICAHD